MNKELFERIDILTATDHSTPVIRALKTAEETGELADAVMGATVLKGKYNHKNRTEADVVEEAADVIICAMSTALKTVPDLSWEGFCAVMATKIDKWENRRSFK